MTIDAVLISMVNAIDVVQHSTTLELCVTLVSLALNDLTTNDIAMLGSCANDVTVLLSFSTIQISSKNDSAISFAVAHVGNIVRLLMLVMNSLCLTSLNLKRRSLQKSSLQIGLKPNGAQLEELMTGKAVSTPIPTETGEEHLLWVTLHIRALDGACL